MFTDRSVIFVTKLNNDMEITIDRWERRMVEMAMHCKRAHDAELSTQEVCRSMVEFPGRFTQE